ncbi:MAG: sulfatase family protein, partial [Planctomycetota bacterium]
MRVFILLATCIVCWLSASERQPNIVIMYADDLGFGDLSIQNPASKISTPNIDQLAREGLRFTDGHSSSGICTPSRYALLTGRYHWRKFHGIVNAFGPSSFDEAELTMPELLRAAGYRTAAIGKWHLGWDWNAIRKPGAQEKAKAKGKGKGKPSIAVDAFDWSRAIPDGPLAHGFDHYFGDTVINFPPYCWIEDDRVTQVPDTMMDTALWPKIKEGNWECRPGPMVSGWNPYQVLPTLAERAVAFVHAHKDSEQPFFLYFALPSPHAPIIPNDRFDGISQAGAYGDFVAESDDACGQILAALAETGLADNTIVVFTADNGSEHYAYERDERFDHWSSAPFRGLKRDLYEGGHHVPFIIRWPGVAAAGDTCPAVVSQIDLMATFAEALGLTLPADQALDSHSLLPLITGSATEARPGLV